MPPNPTAWRNAGLTLDINLGARGGPVTVHIWDQSPSATANAAAFKYVAHVQASALEPALAAIAPHVTSYLSHRNDPK